MEFRDSISENKLKKLRLLLVCEVPIDVRIVDHLASEYELTIITRKKFPDELVVWKPAGEIPVKPMPPNRLLTPFSVFLYSLFLWMKYDIILVLGAELAALGAVVARVLTGKPTVLFLGKFSDEYFMCRYRRGYLLKLYYEAGGALLKLLRGVNLILSDMNIAGGEYLGENVARWTKNFRVVPLYGVDTDIYHPVSAKEKLGIRQKLGLPEKSFFIFFSSRIAPEKDTVSLIKAVKILVNKGIDIILMNLSGAYRDFELVAESYGLKERIIARDAVDPRKDLPLYYQSSDLCVQLSKKEGHGISPLEALACEIPVIATSVGGLNYTIINWVTGLSVSPGGVGEVADAIEYVIDNPKEMMKMAKNGRKMVLDKHNAKLVFSQFDEVVKNMLLIV